MKQMSIFDVLTPGEPNLGTWFEEYPGDPMPWDEVFEHGVGKVYLVDVSTESHIWLKAVRIIRAFWYDDNCFYAGLAPHMVRRVVWDDGGIQNGMYTGDYWPDEANRRFYRWEDLQAVGAGVPVRPEHGSAPDPGTVSRTKKNTVIFDLNQLTTAKPKRPAGERKNALPKNSR